MKGLDNNMYVVLLLISNIIAILLIVAAVKAPRIARISFFLLFTWASVTNITTSQNSPQAYLDYADLSLLRWYKDFINGWFASHIPLVVGTIAIGQALIAITMLLKGILFKTGAMGGIVFLLSIVPLGVGAGFPSTIFMAIALYILIQKNPSTYAWHK